MTPETLTADVAAEYVRIVADGGAPGALSLAEARRTVAGAEAPVLVVPVPVSRPAGARLLAWLVRHWWLCLPVGAALWVVTHAALVVEVVGWGLVALFLLAAFAVWTGGGRARGVRRPVLGGLLIAAVAGWLAGRQPRRSRR